LLSADMSFLFSVVTWIHSSRSWLHKSGGATNCHRTHSLAVFANLCFFDWRKKKECFMFCLRCNIFYAQKYVFLSVTWSDSKTNYVSLSTFG
jgi:hypothetical protein